MKIDLPATSSDARQKQPIEELERKMLKANRRGIWTQEAIDWAVAKGRILSEKLMERME